ncbi:hypothetical protein [Paenibacillus piri]|nr:hypothetical protein [Paenibacillus piri]
MNFKNKDGLIYCCLRNKVVELDQQQHEQFCQGCKMYGGDADGRGVTCVWEELRNVGNPHIVHDPVQEFNRNQKRTIAIAPDDLISLALIQTGELSEPLY